MGADGILHVSAKDKATGKEQRIVIQSSGGLSEDAIQDMIKDAESNQAADAARREAVEGRNELDSLQHSVSKNLEEHADKIDDATKEEVEKALAEAKELAEDASPEEIKEKVSALSAVSMKIGAAMYKGGDQGAAPEGEEAASEPEAKEAEYEEGDGKEKKEEKQ